MHHRVLWLANDYNLAFKAINLAYANITSYQANWAKIVMSSSRLNHFFIGFFGLWVRKRSDLVLDESFSRLVVLPGFGAINPSLISPLNPN